MVSLMCRLIFVVEPGHRAFKFNKITGVRDTIYKEGWHLKAPWIEKPIIYDVRTHPRVIKSITGSKGKSLATLTKFHRFVNG